MAPREGKWPSGYSYITDDEDLSLQADDQDFEYAKARRRCGWTANISTIVALLLGVMTYTWLTVEVTSFWWRQKMLRGPGVVDSMFYDNLRRKTSTDPFAAPIRPWVRYVPRYFPEKHFASEYDLVGEPSDELDQRWEDIMQNFYSEIPYEYMKRMGRLDQGIQLENGNFMASYAVIHILHCVRRLHQAWYPDRYFPNMTETEKAQQYEHDSHCLHMVVNAIMCNADIVPITSLWLDNTPLPSGNFSVQHECVDWDYLMEGLDKIRVDVWKPGLLVHPTFGPIIKPDETPLVEDRIGHQLKGHRGKVLYATHAFEPGSES